MSRTSRARPTAAVLLAVTMGCCTVGLGACASSDAQGETTVPASSAPRPIETATASDSSSAPEPAATQAPVTTVTTISAASSTTTVINAAPTTDVPAPVATETLALTDEEVADLERELDEIDQLLAGVDADLSQD